MKNCHFCTFFVLFLSSVALVPETIMFRNGSSVKGKILFHDAEIVTYTESDSGITKTSQLSQIYKVIHSQGNSELKKFLIEKKGQDFEEDLNDLNGQVSDKKILQGKLNHLEKKIDKMEKRLGKLISRMAYLREKISKKGSFLPEEKIVDEKELSLPSLWKQFLEKTGLIVLFSSQNEKENDKIETTLNIIINKNVDHISGEMLQGFQEKLSAFQIKNNLRMNEEQKTVVLHCIEKLKNDSQNKEEAFRKIIKLLLILMKTFSGNPLLNEIIQLIEDSLGK